VVFYLHTGNDVAVQLTSARTDIFPYELQPAAAWADKRPYNN